MSIRATACRTRPLLAVALVALGSVVVAQDAPPEEEPKDTPQQQQEEAEQAPPAKGEGGETPEATAAARQAKEKPAQESAGTKWRLFADATRGLLTWDLLNGRLTLRVYMRAQLDATVADIGQELRPILDEDHISSLDVRRLSLHAAGTIDRHLAYVVSWEFGADGGPSDAYVEGLNSGLTVFGYKIGSFRAGYFQEPFGLERFTSSYYSGFLERSLAPQTFHPGNNVGYMVYNNALKERLFWAAGFFSVGVTNENNASNSTLSVTGRVTGLPVWREDGRRVIHVGFSHSNRDPAQDEVQYRSRPEARFANFLADTGKLAASRVKLSNLEFAALRGPLWMQAEWTYAGVTAEAGDLAFTGGYVQAGWFMTGELRPYYRTEAIWDRLVPRRNYKKGLPLDPRNGGAFEFTTRYSTVDLNDGAIRGGKLRDLSLGFNWYPNATNRFMVNYIHSKRVDSGEVDIFLFRYQYRPRPR